VFSNVSQLSVVFYINTIDGAFFIVCLIIFCFRRISKLDLWKINKNNKKLLDLRSRSAQEQNKVQHGVRKKANDQEETEAVSVTQATQC